MSGERLAWLCVGIGIAWGGLAWGAFWVGREWGRIRHEWRTLAITRQAIANDRRYLIEDQEALASRLRDIDAILKEYVVDEPDHPTT